MTAKVAALGALWGGGKYAVKSLVTQHWDWHEFGWSIAIGAGSWVAGFWAGMIELPILADILGAVKPSLQGIDGELASRLADWSKEVAKDINSASEALGGQLASAIESLVSPALEERLEPICQSIVTALGSPPSLDTFSPISADFSGQDIASSGLAVTVSGMEFNSEFSSSWRMLYPGTSGLTVTFQLASIPDHPVLSLTHLTSSAAIPSGGYSPVDIYLNGNVVADNYDVAEHHSGSHGFENDDFPIAPYLKTGSNTLAIELEDVPWAELLAAVSRRQIRSTPSGYRLI